MRERRNTPIRRRVQADVLCEALKQLLPEDCPTKGELLLLLAKLPSEGKIEMWTEHLIKSC